MVETEAASSAWNEVVYGALGNMIGGLGATLLWWFATVWWQRRQLKAALAQKRKAISVEVAKIRSWLQLLIHSPVRASLSVPARAPQVLTALVRLGPEVSVGPSLEPALGELDHRIGMVEMAAARLFATTVGIAAAMRGTEDEVAEIQRTLPVEAEKALEALVRFEQAVVAQ